MTNLNHKLLKLIPAVALAFINIISGPQNALADSSDTSSSTYNLKCKNNSGLPSNRASNYDSQLKLWKHETKINDHSHTCRRKYKKTSDKGNYKENTCNQCNYTD
jgi:hypothetical protein